jgi:cardiolipin synthase
LSDTAPRYDYAVSVEGPVLRSIYESVYRLWRTTKWFTSSRRQHGGHLPDLTSSPVGVSPLAFVARDNVQHRRNIERAYRAAVNAATAEVLIASSYFLPGLRVRRALIAAAKRGVKVEILLQGAADHPLLQMATRSLYGTLLGAGIAIYEYTPAMLHAKVAVIDGRWATVGSSNLDPFSLVLNREANIISLDPVFAAALEKSLREEINDHTVRLDRQVWSQRGIGQKVVSWLALGIIRVASLIFGVAAE